MPNDHLPQRAGRGLAAMLLVLAMVAAALSMWTVIPLGWVWIGSQITETQAPSGGPYMVVLAGIVISILLVAWLLSRLNRLYIQLTGTNTVEPIRANWLKSMRDTQGAPRYPSVLETVIISSVILAILAMTAWFLLLAGSPLPSQ